MVTKLGYQDGLPAPVRQGGRALGTILLLALGHRPPSELPDQTNRDRDHDRDRDRDSDRDSDHDRDRDRDHDHDRADRNASVLTKKQEV